MKIEKTGVRMEHRGVCTGGGEWVKLPPGGVLSYMGHIGMCRCEGYVFQAVDSSIGYINQSIWV